MRFNVRVAEPGPKREMFSASNGYPYTMSLHCWGIFWPSNHVLKNPLGSWVLLRAQISRVPAWTLLLQWQLRIMKVGGGILASVLFLFMIFNICTEWITCLWKTSLFCFSIVLWCHLSRSAEFKCPASLQACRGDLGILEYLRKRYFSVLFPRLEPFLFRMITPFCTRT